MFVSSLTNSTILAAIATFAVVLLLWILELVANSFDGWLRASLLSISLIESYNNLVRGIFKTSDLILFSSCIFLGVFLTAQSIHSLRLNRK